MSTRSPGDIATWNRWFAVEMNNRAWELAEKEDRAAEESEEMLHAAHGAALHWSKVGTELNTARAQMLLGQVYALLGEGSLALKYAQAAFDYLTTHNAPDWELAFTHAVLAAAARAAGDQVLYTERYASAQALCDAIREEEDREIFLKTFRLLPVP